MTANSANPHPKSAIKKTHLLLSLLTLFTPIATSCFGASPNIYCYFEDNSNPKVATNSNAGLYKLEYMGATHQTTDQHKFGAASLVIDEKKRTDDIHESGFSSPGPEMNGEIHQMTITSWYRPSDKDSFVIFRRNPSGIPGAISFDYSGDGKCFYFQFTKNDLSSQTYRSAPIESLIPQEWMQISVTFNDGKVVFYLNGVALSAVDTNPQDTTSIPALTGKECNLYGFNGSRPGSYVDDFGVFVDQALSPANIDNIYNKGLEDFVKNSASPVPSATPAK